MVFFQSVMLRELIDSRTNKESTINDNIKNDNIINDNIKDFNFKNLKTNENKMNRIKSIDNFIKFTWSWTI